MHKRAPVAEGPFKITKPDDNTVVIEWPDRSIERASRSRVFLNPTSRTTKEVDDILTPVKVKLYYLAVESTDQPVLIRSLKKTTANDTCTVPNPLKTRSRISL